MALQSAKVYTTSSVPITPCLVQPLVISDLLFCQLDRYDIDTLFFLVHV